ncbi:MAG TPA: hypothetical protein VM737_08105 [Gemmatimonadota bacterium]|nr:hypothetical protein [Gemmatimonadota bacterium]
MTLRLGIAVIVPTAALAIWAAVSHPAGVGFVGIPIFLVTLLAALVGLAMTSRDPPATDALPTSRRGFSFGAAGLVFIAGAAVTAFTWYRVWSYRTYEMEGIPLLLFYFVAFWWPGLFVATWSRFFESGIRSVVRRAYLWRLGAGIAAGVVGAGAYEIGDSMYYRTHDRVPLAEATRYLRSAWTWIVPGTFTLRHDGGRLSIRMEVDPESAGSSYTILRSAEEYLALVREQLRRKDTDRIEVRVEAASGPLWSFEAADADAARPLWQLVRIDRRRLPAGGRLRQPDLEAIAGVWPGSFLEPDDHETFATAFGFGVAGDTVRVEFDPPAAPSPATADLHSVAWRTANAIVLETVRFFPEIEVFFVDLPGVEASVPRERAAADGFRLQRLLVPEERVLGLVLLQEGRGQAVLEPARFYPGGLPIAAAQVAVVRVMDPLEEHTAGALFEEMLVGTGRLYAVGVDSAGAASLIYVPWEGAGTGPTRVTIGAETWLGTELVRNVGWFPRSGFPRPESFGQPEIGKPAEPVLIPAGVPGR